MDQVVIRPVGPSDGQGFVEESKFERYLREARSGARCVFVADHGDAIAGYVTLLWRADDPVLRDADVPEISDLWVWERFRGRGFGSALIERAERQAWSRSETVGLNVGLHSGYGAAQRLYARRGYVPDGAGVVLDGNPVPEGATIRLDDDPIVTLRLTKTLPPLTG